MYREVLKNLGSAVPVSDGDLREIGLTTPQYAVLLYLRNQPGASNASLARQAFVTPQTMQSSLVALEKAGLVTRSQHPEHGRIMTTELTPEGGRALRSASAIVAKTEERLANAAAPQKPETVANSLMKLANAVR